MRAFLMIIFLYLNQSLCYMQEMQKRIRVSDNVDLIKVSENVYMHVSYTEMQNSRVASNGIVFINKAEAFLFDTPMTEALTKDLVSWLTDSMKLQIRGFVPNHWHVDCIGGLGYLHSLGIKSYANQMTIDIAKAKDLPVPEVGFSDSLQLSLNGQPIILYYLGAAHAMDNIVVWIPSEKLLFPGCMIKSQDAVNLGNTTDGDLDAYPNTIDKVLKKFIDARVVVPGHGAFGGIDLIMHTKELSIR